VLLGTHACCTTAKHAAHYVSAPRRVLQPRDTALVVSAAAIHVARRERDRTWRVAISLLDVEPSIRLEEP